MLPVLDAIARVGPSDANVLITGEHGSGKEVVAQTLHALSARASRPLVAVNTGALAEGVFDLEDLRRRTHELADFVGAAAEDYQFPADQVIAVGYSNGANIAASLLLLRPQTLRGAILLRVMVPLIPSAQPDLSLVRVWIGAGDKDPIIPTSESQRLAELLGRAGADVTSQFFDAGHSLTNNEIETAHDWLRSWP